MAGPLTRMLLFVVALGLPAAAWANYDIPANRRTVWVSGLDAEGGIPAYTIKKNAVTDYGADSSGAADATTAIQNCINGVAKPGACYLPAGTYKLTGLISMPAQTVLRGAGPANTVINLSSLAGIEFRGGSKSNIGSPLAITSGYTKDSKSLTLTSTSELAVNNWISLYENNESGLVDTSKCGWCGDDTGSGSHVVQQFAKITAITGNTVRINRPLYYTYLSNLSPSIRKVQFSVYMSGLEDLKLARTQAPNASTIFSNFSRHCWLKNIETDKAGGDNNNEQHVSLWFSHGWEIRDSKFNAGYGNGRGQNYGIHIMFWNSDHKIENNIFYGLRHGVNLEGGGSGTVVLYNYFDGHWESEDSSYLSADLNPNHGPHPMMVLLEGNSSAKLTWDTTMGSSSHNVAFRNHVRAQRTSPSVRWGRWGIDIQANNRHMTLVGNVVGVSSWTKGTVLANGNCTPTEPTAFRFGCNAQPGSYTDSQSRSTSILHGNYDFITDGVAIWDGGSDHMLPNSLYHTTKPPFFGACAWPPFGPDVNGIIGVLPAKDRYEHGSASACVSGGSVSPPAPPTGFRITVP